MASFSSGRPPAGEYRWFFGSWHAAAAASTMWSGVGKSGSPAPNPMTGSPAALSALALASTASVAEGAMAAMRSETRETMPAMVPRPLLNQEPGSRPAGFGAGRTASTAGDLGCDTGCMAAPPSITIPADLLPADGRFGCGPSKVRPEALAALVADAPTYLGTSHRQA